MYDTLYPNLYHGRIMANESILIIIKIGLVEHRIKQDL